MLSWLHLLFHFADVSQEYGSAYLMVFVDVPKPSILVIETGDFLI